MKAIYVFAFAYEQIFDYVEAMISLILLLISSSIFGKCSCSAPEENGAGDLDRILRLSKESKQRKIAENWETEDQQLEPSGLDALATAAVLGVNGG
ncbi:hypothetical protein L6452_42900 [Arctium lappa]|uniref:Uncharacterized protein n=1 Tax=Arctium lappa TaxID=4217 RepID=A0ACB8XL97_ARCLA|nr:hypothetical protein L6452_42900 [Arctium lappa]